MPRPRYSAASQEDLVQIANFAAQDKPLAARKLISAIKEKCRLLARNPELGDSRGDLGERIRSSYVGRYVIFFRATEDAVEIVRIIPGDRDIGASLLIRP